VMRIEAGQFEAAIPYLARAVHLDPADDGTHDALAKAYKGLRRFDEAVITLETGLLHVPESELLYARLADVLIESGRGTEALNRLDQAIARFPTKPLLRLAHGHALLFLKRPTEAAQSFRDALRLNPALTEAQVELGRSLLVLGERPAGKAAIARAFEMRPESVDTLVLLTNLELEDEQWDQAEVHALQLYKIAPQNPDAALLVAKVKLRKGNASAQAGRHDEAEELYRAGLAVNPNFGQLYGGLGMLYGKLRRFDEAIVEFNHYIERSPADPLGYILLGSAYSALRQSTRAREAWSKGLQVARETQNEARASQIEKLLMQIP